MNQILVILLGALAAASIFLFVGWQMRRRTGKLERRLSFYDEDGNPNTVAITQATEEASGESARDQSIPFSQRVIFPLFTKAGGIFSTKALKKDADTLRALLEASGRPKGVTPETIFALQLFTAVAFGVVFWLLAKAMGTDSTTSLLEILAGVAFGFVAPRTILKRKARSRKLAIEIELPDVLDLLTVSVEAGLALEPAMRRVTERMDNKLCEELRKVLGEYTLGQPMAEALRDMADRVGVVPLQSTVRAVVQSDRMGSALGQILRIQSEQVRRERRAKAQEQGQKAPVKMLIPMVGCIFPTIFIVLLGPAVVGLVTPH